jgi:uncharacterized protein
MDIQKNKHLVIYHAHCPDGLASAWVIYHYSGLLGWPKTEIEYYAANYQQDPPNIIGYKNIYIVDFSYKKEILLQMSKQVEKIILMDHHETAIKDLENFSPSKNILIILDKNKAGCQIVWDYFSNQKERPWFIDVIADRDLWKFKLQNSKEINAALAEEGYLRSIQKMNELLMKNANDFIEIGKQFCKFRDSILGNLASKSVKTKFQGYICYAVNSNIFISELGDHLNKSKSDCEIAIIYRYNLNDKKWEYSFRSNKVNLSELLKPFGGGGHPAAGGMSSEKLIFN